MIISNAASHREQTETEDLRPTKRQALDANDVYPLPTTVVAVDRPAESNELHKLELRELGQTRAVLELTELVKKHSQQLFFSWKPELRMIF